MQKSQNRFHWTVKWFCAFYYGIPHSNKLGKNHPVYPFLFILQTFTQCIQTIQKPFIVLLCPLYRMISVIAMLTLHTADMTHCEKAIDVFRCKGDSIAGDWISFLTENQCSQTVILRNNNISLFFTCDSNRKSVLSLPLSAIRITTCS